MQVINLILSHNITYQVAGGLHFSTVLTLEAPYDLLKEKYHVYISYWYR